MRIQHNISALNTHRNLAFNNAQASKNLEKLSSGYKINRAGDDAAGLAISEKMRGQIRGLDMATKNSQDSISLIQTAEGALNETHSILQRMRELSVQSANDTNVNSDREAIQQEIEQLTTEINRIAETTEFNTQKLLDGSFSGTFQIGANEGQTMSMDVGAMDTASLDLTKSVKVAQSLDLGNIKMKDGAYTINTAGTAFVDAKGNEVAGITISNEKITQGSENVSFAKKLDAAASLKDANVTVKDGKISINIKASDEAQKLSAGKYEISGENVLKDGIKVGTFVAADNKAKISVGGKEVEITKTELNLAENLADKQTFTIGGLDVSTREQAAGSIKSVDDAIQTVSKQRSQLGAVQNRLEHTINNLGAASENLTAAESRIRDTDMAKEMMEFTKNNILMQAAQSMLAQANQQPQGVLQLLG